MSFGKRFSVEILLLLVIGLLLGLMGPFGTYSMPTGIRLLYWTGFILVGYLFFRPVSSVVGWLDEITAMPQSVAVIITVAAAAFPLTILIAIAIGGFSWRGNPMLLDHFGLLYAQVAAIGVGIFLLMRLLFGREMDATAGQSPPTSQSPTAISPDMEASEAQMCRLASRLPGSFSGPIASLGVEDHYVRVFASDGGSEMLLMRLADAIAEMQGVEGLQTHRSWWVSKAAIRRTVRDGRNIRLLLDNGQEIPVSRNNISAVRDAGFL